MTEDVCRNCSWKSFGAGCVLWKYLSPEICRLLKEDSDRIPLRTYQSPPLESVNVVRILCGFDYSSDPEIKPTGTYYKYSKITSVMNNRYWIIKSRESITEKEYNDFNKEKKSPM